MNSELLLEISVESLDCAVAAERGGANRIELCENLAVGGLTPCEQLMRDARAKLKLPIFAMIRPRAESFVYSAAELSQMRCEIVSAKACGMDGLVLGVLRADNTVDVEQTSVLVELARPLPVTFHRAFDETPNLHSALKSVISTGATRILTSGGKRCAFDGAAAISELVQATNGHIKILPGAGINASNLRDVVRLTCALEFHSGLGSSIPYGQSTSSSFESAVRQLASILSSVATA
jgi:copper homeostasis protein